jgi:hypothetical protein
MTLLKEITEYEMRVLIFSTNFVLNISHFKNDTARSYHKFT